MSEPAVCDVKECPRLDRMADALACSIGLTTLSLLEEHGLHALQIDQMRAILKKALKEVGEENE